MSFNQRLGFALSPDGTAVQLTPSPEHEAVPGAVHFAVLATLGEVAAAHAAEVAVVPTHVSLQLLRMAKLEPLEGRGRVLRAGRTLIFAEGEVTQAGQLVAKVSVTFARV